MFFFERFSFLFLVSFVFVLFVHSLRFGLHGENVHWPKCTVHGTTAAYTLQMAKQCTVVRVLWYTITVSASAKESRET